MSNMGLPMAEMYGFDCYSPSEIAERVESVGVRKANLPLMPMIALGVLAGGFIGLGAMFATIVFSDASLSFAVGRILGGLVFSLGLILVVLAGAELFTGNNLLVMACVSGRISLGKFLSNLAVVYVANFIGAFGLAVLVAVSGHPDMNAGAIRETVTTIAQAKVSLPVGDAFFKGVLCNLLVCLAVWIAMAGRTVTDRVAAIVFPITAFVAAGFEHSVANMYFIPLGMMLGAKISTADLMGNLIPVTLGNLVGGAVMVGLVYHTIYRRDRANGEPPKTA